MKAVAAGLGLPNNYFEDKCYPPINIISFWHYFPHPAKTDSWGVGPHTDYGMWTFLLQDDVGGLEAEITEGKWTDVKPIPGSVNIIFGYLFSINSTCMLCFFAINKSLLLDSIEA